MQTLTIKANEFMLILTYIKNKLLEVYFIIMKGKSNRKISQCQLMNMLYSFRYILKQKLVRLNEKVNKLITQGSF